MKLRYSLIMLVCMFSSTTTLADVHPIVGTSIIGTSIIGTSIIGTWALEVSAPRGVQHPTLKVTGDKDSYHGVLTGQRGQVPIKEIQVEENTFGFPLKVPTRYCQVNFSHGVGLIRSRHFEIFLAAHHHS